MVVSATAPDELCEISTSDEGDLVERDEVSERHAIDERMREARKRAELIDRTSEDGARLHGLLAVLALPAMRCQDGAYRRPKVEIEIKRGVWAEVESIIIDDKGMTFLFGTNGHTTRYHFPGTICPNWRPVRMA